MNFPGLVRRIDGATDVNATSLNIDAGALSGAAIASGGSIDGVVEVGFYFQSTEDPNRFDILDFEVTAVPEPSTAMMLLESAGLLALRRRHK